MTRPRLARDANFLPGLAAVALFGVFAAAFLNVPLPEPATFGGDAALTRSIGAALFNIDPSQVVDGGGGVQSEGFLVAFLIVAVVLDAALDGSLMLAKRDDEGPTMADGGPSVSDGASGADDGAGGDQA